jgi:glycosyltransferase involved in cell wall biosynthesis
MSLAVLEGMATGLAVIGSRTMDGLVEPSVSGFIISESSDAEQIAEYRRLLEQTSEAEWDAMGEQARKSVHERFTWDAVATKTCAVYCAVAGK